MAVGSPWVMQPGDSDVKTGVLVLESGAVRGGRGKVKGVQVADTMKAHELQTERLRG